MCACVCVCVVCVCMCGCEKVCTVCVCVVCELIGVFAGVIHTADTATFVVQKNNTKVNSFQDKRVQCIYQYVGNIILMYSIYCTHKHIIMHITTPTFQMFYIPKTYTYTITQTHSQECSPIREHSQ